MSIANKVVVVTGAASGIGAALAKRFLQEEAAALVLGDVQMPALDALASELNAEFAGGSPTPRVLALRCDVTQEPDIQALVALAEKQFGRVDLYCSNAGLVRDGGEETPDADWQLNWDIHVMAHVWAARAVLPGMVQRGLGQFMVTASAAGLLTSLPSTSYAVTKHAAIAFAESMAIRHAPSGVQFSVLCPQAVDTPLIRARANVPGISSSIDGVASTDDVCNCVVAALESGQFLILPHPQVLEFFRRKANDYDRWLGGMRKLDSKFRLGK